MSLSTAISTAQTIFSNTGLQSSALAKNIENASNPDYARRVGVLAMDSTGAQKLEVNRTYDNGLVKQTMYSTADSAAQDTLQTKLDDIKSLLGGNDYTTSPSTYIAKLRDNLQAYATKPNESTLATSVVSAAKDVANSLNSISSSIQSARGTIDGEIKDQVTALKNLLTQFKDVNDTIKSGTALKHDVNNELDTRESLLKKISEIVGIRTFTRGDNDMALYTSDGTMLFEGDARDVSFTPNNAYDSSVTGNPVLIDGVAMKPGSGGDTSAKGKLQALLQARDDIIPTYQSQLDETSRGLIEMFAQTDQTGGGANDIPGLFTYTGYASGDTLPATGTLVTGLASTIKVNDALVKSSGGDPTLLRDGGYDVDGLGIASSTYLANTNNDAGYSDQLDGYVQGFETTRSFDSSAQIDATATIGDFATESVGWLEQLNKESSTAKENKTAQLSRITESLSNTTGVSLDEEMSLMLDLEQSYKASSKLVTTIDSMMEALLSAVR
jgi:flagellar hook-associated protein 1 FlgK